MTRTPPTTPTDERVPIFAPLPPDADHAGRRERLRALHERMWACRRCMEAGYLERADSVGATRGRIGDRVMVVGQAPGRLSVANALPFSGPGGGVLDGWLTRAGFPAGALHREVYLSALTRCDPGRNPRGGGDRKPSPPELALCRPFLVEELALVRPQVILLVGGMAIAAFLGSERLEEVVGRGFERAGVRLLPLPHPSGVSRWLNDPAHQTLLARGLALLAEWRATISPEDVVNAIERHE